MPPKNPDRTVDFAFVLHGIDYPIQVRRGAIVHEAFHVALPTEFTAGHRLIFRTLMDAKFILTISSAILSIILASTGSRRLLNRSRKPNAWRNIGFDHLVDLSRGPSGSA